MTHFKIFQGDFMNMRRSILWILVTFLSACAGSSSPVSPPPSPFPPLPAVTSTCGNSLIESPEQCDDGNQINTDECLPSCLLPTCGDGFVRANQEECDDGNTTDTDTCNNLCRLNPANGNNNVTNNNTTNNNSNNNQTTQAVCGNNILEGSEACDDGGTVNGDGCSSACNLEQVSGDNSTLSIPLIVNDANNTVSRDPVLTSFLIPLSRGANIFTTNNLAVRNIQGALLPAQFEILSRWGAYNDTQAPIRFAYAFVRSTPPVGGQTTWRVTNETPAPTRSPGIVTQDTNGQWIITTGPARFTISHQRNARNYFEGLSRVELQNGGTFQTVSQITGSGTAGFLMQHNGNKSTEFNAPWYLEMERSGPEVVTIAARGYYVNAAGQGDANGDGQIDIGYTVRLHFYAGSSAVKIDHTYYHFDVNNSNADGASNTTVVDRSWMRIPISALPSQALVRAETSRLVNVTTPVRVEQLKRVPLDATLPSNPDAGSAVTVTTRYALETNGSTAVVPGRGAPRPFLAVVTPQYYAMGTIARMAVREPQGLRYNPTARALELDFTSSRMQIGGARGIWSTAVVDFGLTRNNLEARADQIQLHAEAPLLATPNPNYVNATQTIGPYATNIQTPYARFFPLLDFIHRNTNTNLQITGNTGLQTWPDLPITSCNANGNCRQPTDPEQMFEGGHNNYWNWSKPGFDEFFRTGRNNFVYDFSLGEAISFVETFDIRTDHFLDGRQGRNEASTVRGVAPCYDSSRAFGDPYREGLGHRINCPASYEYNKTFKLAYLATADRRFVDFFEEAGVTAINRFGLPPVDRPDQYHKLQFNRFSEQRLENIANGAEFSRSTVDSPYLLNTLRQYVDFMLPRALIDGHSCNAPDPNVNAPDQRGYNSVLAGTGAGQCGSAQGWMMPTPIEWTLRVSRLLNHVPLQNWIIRHAQRAAENHTVLGTNGLPDYSQRQASVPGNNNRNGWRTVYNCSTTTTGIGTCTKFTDPAFENSGYFYDDGLMAFLNVFGFILAADPSDPNRICQWLPTTYAQHLNGLAGTQDVQGNFAGSTDFAGGVNGYVWGKPSGQSFGMAAEAVGALTAYCP